MVRATEARAVVTGEKTYFEYAGLHDDEKPVRDDIATGSTFLEVDTGDVFAYDEESSEWKQIASLGGGA